MPLASRSSHRRCRLRSELAPRCEGLRQAIGGSDYGSEPQTGFLCSRHGLPAPPGLSGGRDNRMAENRHGGTFVNCEFIHIGHCLARFVKVHGCQAQCVLGVRQSILSKCAARFSSKGHAVRPQASRSGPNNVPCPAWAWQWPGCSTGCCDRASDKPQLAMTCGSGQSRPARGLTA